MWVGRVDGSDLFQISDVHSGSGSPAWSPDGTAIAFDSRPTDRFGKPVDRWGIYVVTPIEGNPRRLITNISGTIRPHWSHVGKWVYFRSYEVGRSGIYRCPASGGDAVVLSRDPEAFAPQESLDGATVYFVSHEINSVLKKIPLTPLPGTESQVEGMPRIRDSTLWALSRSGIYFVPADAPRSMCYFDFASKEVRHVFDLNKDFGKGLSVSQDGRWIMYSLIGEVNSDIMLVDHFR